jgi:hypothetical protein
LLEVPDALKAAEVDDRVRQAAEAIYQALIEAELTAVTGAQPHQRTEARTGLRNGHRARTITTTAGDLELKIPRLRAGSFFPSLLERRRRVDQSLFAVIMEDYLLRGPGPGPDLLHGHPPCGPQADPGRPASHAAAPAPMPVSQPGCLAVPAIHSASAGEPPRQARGAGNGMITWAKVSVPADCGSSPALISRDKASSSASSCRCSTLREEEMDCCDWSDRLSVASIKYQM